MFSEYADRLNGVWINVYYDTYTYDNLGNCLTEIEEIWANDTWLNSWMWTYTYDNSGNCLIELDKGWTSNVWEDRYTYKYTYDNSGNCLSEIDEYWTHNSWLNSNRFIYTYDNNDNGIHGESFQWQESSWIPSKDNMIMFYNNHSDYSIYTGSIVDVEYTAFTTEIIPENSNIKSFSLAQNYPNPFNPTTIIKYSIPTTSFVKLKVYDVIGREVATLVNEEKAVGNYNVEFNGSDLSSGIYFYRIQAGDYSSVKKMILIK